MILVEDEVIFFCVIGYLYVSSLIFLIKRYQGERFILVVSSNENNGVDEFLGLQIL